jgi:muramidase (phage lysozyme)
MISRTEKAAPLLALLRKHESDGAVNSQGVPDAYSVVYGGIPKGNRPKALLTTYPISEVLEWQRFVVNEGADSSAAGAYQIIRKTLDGLPIPKREKFDEACQDEAAMMLLDRRGWGDCESGKMAAVDFADMLAREWASLPVQRDQRGATRQVKRGQSYYAGDGLNKASATPEEVLKAVNSALVPPETVIIDTAERMVELEARMASFEAWATSVNASLDRLEKRRGA